MNEPNAVAAAHRAMAGTAAPAAQALHTGAMTRRANVLDELEPEAVAGLAPAETAPAQHRRRRAGARHHEARRNRIEGPGRPRRCPGPGQVFIPFCYAEAAANVLTNPQLDPFRKIPEYKFCAAKVEPIVAPAAASSSISPSYSPS